MNQINIDGYGDDLSINGVRIGDLSPSDHEKLSMKKEAKIIKPLLKMSLFHM